MKRRMLPFVHAALALALSLVISARADADESGNALSGYFAVAKALVDDDLDSAKKAAAALAEQKDSSLAPAAAKVAASDSLKTARDTFQELSAAAIKVAEKSEGTYHVMACPMVKGGLWVQIDEEVRNPYMGQKMVGCGGPVKAKP